MTIVEISKTFIPLICILDCQDRRIEFFREQRIWPTATVDHLLTPTYEPMLIDTCP